MYTPHMHNRGTFYILALLFLFSLILSGCGGGGGGGDNSPKSSDINIYGQVFDASSDKPLKDALITAKDVKGSIKTDEKGRFAFPVPGNGTYKIKASQSEYTYAQRKAKITGQKYFSVEDIYLTPIDPKAISIGPEGGNGTNSDGSIAVQVPSGALSSSHNLHATWYSEGKHLPNDLPELSHFTYACELTPDGLEFEKPVTLKMKNTKDLPPGTPVPVGVYDPKTLKWTHESMGKVSDDGRWVVYTVKHFSPRDCNLGRTSPSGSGGPGAAEDETDKQQTEKNNENCGSISIGSRVDVADGHLTVDHLLPAYTVLGEKRTIAFQYNSHMVYDYPVLSLAYDITKTSAALPDRIRFTVRIAGRNAVGFFIPTEGKMNFKYVWNGTDLFNNELEEGTYNYSMILENEYATTFAIVDAFGESARRDTGVTADEYLRLPSFFNGTVRLEKDPTAGHLGWGWGIMDLFTLTKTKDHVQIKGGDGTVHYFTPDGQGGYNGTSGDFSTLKKSGSKFKWTRSDLSVYTFDSNGRQIKKADRNNNITTFEYDDEGKLTRITDPTGKVTLLSYDSNDRLDYVTDPSGRKTDFQVNDSGELIKITNPDSTFRSFTYDNDHLMNSQTDASSMTTNYSFNSQNQVFKVKLPDNSSVRHNTHITGLINTFNGSQGSEENPVSFDLGSDSPSYTDAEGNKYLFTLSDYGTRTSIEDPLGRKVQMLRNEDNKIYQFISPSGYKRNFDYNEKGRLTSASGPNTNYPLEVEYNGTLGLPTKISESTMGTWQKEYDSNGNLISTTMPDGRDFTFTYSDQGLRTSINCESQTVTYTYNKDGNLKEMVDPSGGVWRYTYDKYGNLNSIEDPDNSVRTLSYNKMNLLEKATNHAGNTIEFRYAPAKGSLNYKGRGPLAVLTSITDGRGNTTTFSYDSMHRLIGIEDPLNKITSLGYDRNGRLVSRQEPSGSKVEYSYNKAGQLIKKTLDNKTNVTYTYDPDDGMLNSMENQAMKIDITYDSKDMLQKISRRFKNNPLTVDLDYDKFREKGWPDTLYNMMLSDDDYSSAGYGYYDPHGLYPTDMYISSYLWLDLSYDDLSRLTEVYDSYTGLSGTFSYDQGDRLKKTAFSGEDSFSVEFDYSAAGYMTSLQHQEGTSSLSYDQARRLTEMVHANASISENEFSYDAAGNRRIKSQESQFDYDASNRLLEDKDYKYEYDGSGNLISKENKASGNKTSYSYNSENYLTKVQIPDGTVVEFTYGPMGRRIQKSLNGSVLVRYIHKGNQLIAEFDGTNTLSRQYLLNTEIDKTRGMRVGTLSSYEDYFYYIDDLGTVYAVVEDWGDIVNEYRYKSFGSPVFLKESVECNQLFAGAYYDRETGLYFMRYRYYDPETGRFLQKDPLLLNMAVSTYSYAGNRPYNSRDPFGLGPDSGSTMDRFGTLFDAAVKPQIEKSLEKGLEHVPHVGSHASKAWGTYTSYRDVFKVFGSDNPAEAGIEWYKERWWNPADEYTEDFLTLGGSFERREARVHEVCGLKSGIKDFFGF